MQIKQNKSTEKVKKKLTNYWCGRASFICFFSKKLNWFSKIRNLYLEGEKRKFKKRILFTFWSICSFPLRNVALCRQSVTTAFPYWNFHSKVQTVFFETWAAFSLNRCNPTNLETNIPFLIHAPPVFSSCTTLAVCALHLCLFQPLTGCLTHTVYRLTV